MLNRREMARSALAGVVAAVAIACGSAARDAAGEVMRDAGVAMADAGHTMRDAGMHVLADAAVGAGGALADAGAAMMDAGAAVRDAGGSSGGSDAHAQPAGPTTMTADCNIEGGRSVTTGSVSSLYSSYVAEFDVRGLSHEQLAGATVFVCDRQGKSPYDQQPCPDGSTCTDVGIGPLPDVDCEVQGSFELVGSKVRVYCGNRDESAGTVVYDWKWSKVELVLQPH